MKKVFVSVLICSFFYGCVSNSSVIQDRVELPVKIIDEELSRTCKFVGVATGYSYNPFKSKAENVAEAKLTAAKKAFLMGGNAAVMNFTYVEYPSNYVAVNMNACDCLKL